MKKLLSVLLLGLLLFTFTSCADDDEGGSNSGFPTSFVDFDELGFDIMFGIWKDYDYGNEDVYIDLISFEEPDDWDFELDGEDIDILDWEEEEGYNGEDYWSAEIDYDDLEDIDFDAGDKIDYVLEFNDKNYEGELEILAYLDVDWDDFDFDEDFEFDWDIDEDPNIYDIWFNFEAEDGNDDEYLFEAWQIDGNEDEYSISNNYYEDFEDWEYYWMSVQVAAFNFINHGKCLTFSQTGDYTSFGSYYKSTQKQIDPKERLKRTIEMFKKKFNK